MVVCRPRKGKTGGAAVMMMMMMMITVGLDGVEDLVAQSDLVDVIDVGVGEQKELVGEGQVRLLLAFLTLHLSVTTLKNKWWM